MSRRVTLTLILVGFLLALSSAALAQKDPINAKQLPVTHPDAPKASAELNSALPEMPLQFTKTATPDQQAVVAGIFSHAPAFCDTYSYWDGTPFWFWTIPDMYDDDFFNMRFTVPGGQIATLANVYFGFYDAGSSVVSPDGVDVIVWDDDGFGFPATELARINVPAALMAWYPNAVAVDFTPFDLTFTGADFHIGFTTVNKADDVYAILSDEGTTGAGRSSEYYTGMWGTMSNDWGLDVNFVIEAEVCWEVGPEPLCYLLKYNGDAYYYWTIPDAYGDDYFNVRFTMPDLNCWLVDLNIAFYADGSVGAPGADFILFNSTGTYPTDTIAVYVVPVVTSWFPAYETVDVEADNIVIFSDFHLGYTPIYNDPSDVLACLSDDGSSGTLRSSENWGGYWGLMVDDWGVDVAFLMEVNVCCPVAEEVEYTCVEETEWPTLSHDYARTGDSRIEIGDLCGFQKIWEYWSPYDWCYFANPTIANELVYTSFGVHLECFTVAGDGAGNPVSVWSTMTADPAYAVVIGGNVRTSPTIEDGVIYFGAGTLEGFVAADAFTGVPIWIRSPMPPYSNPLEGTPGATRFTPTVIIGDYVYFGSDGGTIYKLNKFTGVTDVWRYTPHGMGIWNSPSSDGTDIYIGCAMGLAGGDAGAGSTVGGIYKLRGTDLELHPDWPYGGFSGLLGWNEGTTAGATYSESRNWLFTNLGLADHTSFDSYAMIIDAADGTPATDDYWLSGQPFYATSTVFDGAELWYYGAVPNADGRYSGIWCRNYDNNSVWQDFTGGAMTNPAAVTCDPYVFWGTRVHPYGTFNCSSALWGEHIFTYELTGYGFGAAIAKYAGVPYVAQTQIWSDCGTGGGRLTMYSMGDDRPRLDVPAGAVLEPPLSFTDPSGSQRTVDDIFCNAGCVPLEYCLALEAHPSYPTAAYVTTVNPYSLARADKNATDVAEFTIDDFNAMEGWKAAKMQNRPVLESEYGDRVMEAKQSDFSLSGPPSWVLLASSATGTLGPYSCYDAVLEFDVPNMRRGSNLFRLVVATDDPDYNECPTALPLCNGLEVNTMIEINAVVGFAFCDFYLDFGFGGDDWEYANNGGWFDDGDGDDNFIVDGMQDPLYQGSFWWGLRTNRLAWLEEGGKGFNHLFPDTVCTTHENILLDEFCDGTEIYGDYFEAAVIDSIYDYETEELADSLTIGMRMLYREYGAFAESGSDYFNNFKLIAYDLSNRNATPVDDLYWGVFADWDMPGDPAGYEQVFGDLSASAMWQFNEVSGEVAGYGILPMIGSAMYPTGLPSMGTYNGYGYYYDWYFPYQLPRTFMESVTACAQGNICYHPNADPGSPPDDRVMILTANKHSFGGHETAQGAFVVFAFPTGATVGEITDLMQFANKWAGYGRGDVNNDGLIDLLDLTHLARYVYSPADNCGQPCPFIYLGDVDCDDDVDSDDAQHLYDFMFTGGPPPMSKLIR